MALVGNGSFVEMTVNAKLYEDEGVVSVASACAVRECFEARNIASTNQGPVPSNISAVQWAVENLGTKKVACVGLNIPRNGVWSCNLTSEWLTDKGLEGVSVLMDPGAPDPNASLLEAVASGADTILMSLPAGLAQAFLKAAQDQDLRDQYKWISPTPLYKQGIPEALGDYWSGKVHVAIELTPWDGAGPDGKRWLKVMDKYARAEDPRDTFSQAGFVSANIFVDTLLKMDPTAIDRANVTKALKAVKNYRTDLLCGPWYFGDADFHQPNHASLMIAITKDGFKPETQCFDVTGKYFDRIREHGEEAAPHRIAAFVNGCLRDLPGRRARGRGDLCAVGHWARRPLPLDRHPQSRLWRDRAPWAPWSPGSLNSGAIRSPRRGWRRSSSQRRSRLPMACSRRPCLPTASRWSRRLPRSATP